MRRVGLFWKLYATYLLTVALCALAVGWFAIASADHIYHDQAAADLESRAHLIAQEVVGLIGTTSPARLEDTVQTLGQDSHTRITVIAGQGGTAATAAGQVLADSDVPAADLALLPNHDTPDRPEVRTALMGGTGESVRFSSTLKEEMMYVAIPVRGDAGKVTAVIRTALPLTTVNRSLDVLARRIALIAGLVALAVAGVGLLVTRRITTRLSEIRRGAERFAGGDFSHELYVSRVDEIGSVAASLNLMASQLHETIEEITEERNEREAVLSGMVEGVLAIDDDERVITVNYAAIDLLGMDDTEAEGRSIQEVVRNPDLQRLVADTLAADAPVERDIMVRAGLGMRDVQAHGARLHDASGDIFGAVIVLNDITRLKRLEAVRRDFVANVSHEIKTPVTSIKGFAETLLDGALDDRETAERFLKIIAGQTDRLSAIIEDLLSLSSLERGTEEGAVALERGSVRDVLQVAADVCARKAVAKEISVTVTCDPQLFADMNPPLLEQAVVNLIDNAIKYSPDGAAVKVSAGLLGEEIVMSVADHGVGIAKEHLPRLFERFYRVDKARSRDLGGTGLGLSIVKHIAQVHGGTVSVESTPGAGSTFRIHLPA